MHMKLQALIPLNKWNNKINFRITKNNKINLECLLLEICSGLQGLTFSAMQTKPDTWFSKYMQTG